MNKEQRIKLSELEAQLRNVLTNAKTLLDEEQMLLDGLHSEDPMGNNAGLVNMLKFAFFCLDSAVEYIVDAESMADSMPKEGGEK